MMKPILARKMLTAHRPSQYFIQPFQMLSWEWSIAAWKGHYFFGHIVAVIFFVICTMLPTPKTGDKKKKKA